MPHLDDLCPGYVIRLAGYLEASLARAPGQQHLSPRLENYIANPYNVVVAEKMFNATRLRRGAGEFTPVWPREGCL